MSELDFMGHMQRQKEFLPDDMEKSSVDEEVTATRWESMAETLQRLLRSPDELHDFIQRLPRSVDKVHDFPEIEIIRNEDNQATRDERDLGLSLDEDNSDKLFELSQATPQRRTNSIPNQNSYCGGQPHNQQADPNKVFMNSSTLPYHLGNASESFDVEAGMSSHIERPVLNDHKGNFNFEENVIVAGPLVSAVGAVSAKNRNSEMLWCSFLACIFMGVILIWIIWFPTVWL